MKTYGSISALRGLLFDIDGTLYDSRAYLDSQRQVLVEQLAMELGRSYDDIRTEVRETQNRMEDASGERPTLANTFREFGIGIRKSAEWRSKLMNPERYLDRDPKLNDTLAKLSERMVLVALTNNPSDIALRTLRCLGVAEHFTDIVGIDDTFASKPDLAPFRMALQLARHPANQVAVVGDRYDADIAPALELGMAGVLVDGVKDVYLLPEFLSRTG
jgi:FMN phosphatase YigB (HAD superfamily)